MAESLDPVDRTPDMHNSEKVNPADRSNPEKKDNGFSNLLKEKMKEKLKEKAEQKDEVILDNETEDNDQRETPDSPPDVEQTKADETDTGSGGNPLEHVDLKA